MNEAKVVISKEACIGAEALINKMRQKNEVSQMPIVGKKGTDIYKRLIRL